MLSGRPITKAATSYLPASSISRRASSPNFLRWIVSSGRGEAPLHVRERDADGLGAEVEAHEARKARQARGQFFEGGDVAGHGAA